jgi:FkbH-like protein
MKDIKCIVWDLDNTIWDGILLEDGDVELNEGIADIIMTLDSRGILHSISSRNDFETASKKLKEFGLWEYFLFPEINWNNKSLSVKKIAENLNIGFDSIMFIDDQEYERDEVKYSLQDVECIDAVNYKSLSENPRLKSRFITDDSSRRRFMYLEDIKRKDDEENYSGPKEEFIKSLKMVLRISRAEESDLQRIEELTVRTNQLNTTGKSYDYEELKSFLKSDKYILLVAELKDVYGSYGKIGLVLIEKQNDEWRIKLFILSCRVMNRGVGTILLNEIMKAAREFSKRLTAEFLHTQKNRMMYITLKFANFIEAENQNGNEMVLLNNDLTIINSNPQFINLITENEWN